MRAYLKKVLRLIQHKMDLKSTTVLGITMTA